MNKQDLAPKSMNHSPGTPRGNQRPSIPSLPTTDPSHGAVAVKKEKSVAVKKEKYYGFMKELVKMQEIGHHLSQHINFGPLDNKPMKPCYICNESAIKIQRAVLEWLYRPETGPMWKKIEYKKECIRIIEEAVFEWLYRPVTGHLFKKYKQNYESVKRARETTGMAKK